MIKKFEEYSFSDVVNSSGDMQKKMFDFDTYDDFVKALKTADKIRDEIFSLVKYKIENKYKEKIKEDIEIVDIRAINNNSDISVYVEPKEEDFKRHGKWWEIYISKEEYEEYIENPELYFDKNKFNL